MPSFIRNRKAAIELSMNFLVMMIISITIFAFGVQFVYRISSQAIELKDLTADELDARVDDLLCSSSTKVCIGKDTQTVGRGEFKAYGIKILNVENEQDFTIKVAQPNNPTNPPTSEIGFKKDGSAITLSQATGRNIEFAPQDREITDVPRNGEQLVGIGVTVPKDALSGTYILNVKILRPVLGVTNEDCTTSPNLCYVSLQKLYVNVP